MSSVVLLKVMALSRETRETVGRLQL